MLKYKDRTKEITNTIDRVFQEISEIEPNWSYNGEIGYYNIGCISELATIKHIINSNSTQKDFYIMDVGAGEFQFSRQLVEDLNKAAVSGEIRSDVTVHIIGARGERYEGKGDASEIGSSSCALSQKDIEWREGYHYDQYLRTGKPEYLNEVEKYTKMEQEMDQGCEPLRIIFTTENLDEYSEGICKVYNFGAFPLENFDRALAERGFDGVRLDFVVSSWTMQHLVDPVGTFMQIHEKLSTGEHTGYFLSTGFFLHFKGEQHFTDGMERFLSYTNEPFLLFKNHHLNSFFLKKTQESLDVSMEYDSCGLPCALDSGVVGCNLIQHTDDDGNYVDEGYYKFRDIASNIITSFRVNDHKTYEYLYKQNNKTNSFGDQKLHYLLSNNDLFSTQTYVYDGNKKGFHDYGHLISSAPECASEPEYYGALFAHTDNI